MTEKEFKKLFETKLGSREVPFDGSSWTAMESILDAKAQSMAYYWKAASVIAISFTVGIGAGVWNWQEARDQQQIANESIQNTISIPDESPEKSEKTSLDFNTSETIVSEDFEPTSQKTPATGNEAVYKAQQKPSDPRSILASSKTNETTNSVPKKEVISEDRVESDSKMSNIKAAYVSDDAFDDSFLKNKKPLDLIPVLVGGQKIDFDESFANAQEAPQEPTETFTEEALDRLKKKNEFYFQGVFLTSDAFNSEEQANGFGIGLGVRHRFNQKWSMVTELNYMQKNQPGIASHTDSIVYGFGMEEIHSTLEVTKIQSLELPLLLEFAANRHQLGFGVYAAYIFSTTSDLSRAKISFKGEETAEKTELVGDSPLVNNLDFGLRMSYYYQVNPMLSIGASSSLGLIDVTNDSSMQNEEFNRNIDLRLGVKYRIF